ncbi:MAG: MHYT domain-containing protein, partial [Maricaulaceae bacterium]
MIILGLRLGSGAEGTPVSHDQVLAALSFVVAAASFYAALELSERFFRAQHAARLKWLAACAVILGGGVWSMHVIALAALESPFERGYNAGILGAAAVTVVLAVAGALWIVRDAAGPVRLGAAGALLGAGVVVMHILGEQALIVDGALVHQPARVVFSAVLAVAAGVGAAWAAARARAWWKRIAAAFMLAVGFALSHYIGSPAAVIGAAAASEAGAPVMLDAVLSATIAYAMIAVATFGLVGAYLERRIQDRLQEEAHHIRQIKDSLEQRVDQRTAHLMRTAQNLDASLRNAERSSAAKSDFLASLSHELRTPLN